MTQFHGLKRVLGAFARGAMAMMAVGTAGWPGPEAQAGVFNYPHFVTPGDFALGLEPELTFTSGAGVGISARYTQGLSDLMNVSAILGTGSGPRQFRVGGATTFDFFPDIDKQPGIGVTLQGLYIRVPTPGRADGSTDMTGQVELTAIPYIHKAVVSGSSELEPFLGIPFGMAFADGQYRALSSLVIGSMFKTSESIRTSIEFGIAINHTESYLSAGVTYYH